MLLNQQSCIVCKMYIFNVHLLESVSYIILDLFCEFYLNVLLQNKMQHFMDKY